MVKMLFIIIMVLLRLTLIGATLSQKFIRTQNPQKYLISKFGMWSTQRQFFDMFVILEQSTIEQTSDQVFFRDRSSHLCFSQFLLIMCL